MKDVVSPVHHLSIGDVLTRALVSEQITYQRSGQVVNTVAGNKNTVYPLFVGGQAPAIRTPRTMISTQEDENHEPRTRRVRLTAGLLEGTVSP